MSGDAPPEKRWQYLFGKNERFIDTVYMSDSFPGWLSEGHVDVYAQTFERTGYFGGLNWYRNVDRKWERTGFLSEAKINHNEKRLSQDSVTGQEHEPARHRQQRGQLNTHCNHIYAREVGGTLALRCL